MKVFRRVKPEHRSGRGLYWRANGQGYTNDIAWAGLYEASTYTDGNADEIAAMPLLLAEESKQMERLSAVRALITLADGVDNDPREGGDGR